MQLLVAQAEGHPALEVASWIVAIVAFGLGILQLVFYWFGRNFPLQIGATGQIAKRSDGQQVVRLIVEFRSRTRDVQTVRELLLSQPPNLFMRALWPWWYKKAAPATPSCAILPRLPLTVDGHDTGEVRVAFPGSNLPYGRKTRLRVRASRRRPHVARVRMKAGPRVRNEGTSASDGRGAGTGQGKSDLPKELEVGTTGAIPVWSARGTLSPKVSDRKAQEPRPDVGNKPGLRVWTRTLADLVPDQVKSYVPMVVALIVLVAFRRVRSHGAQSPALHKGRDADSGPVLGSHGSCRGVRLPGRGCCCRPRLSLLW